MYRLSSTLLKQMRGKGIFLICYSMKCHNYRPSFLNKLGAGGYVFFLFVIVWNVIGFFLVDSTLIPSCQKKFELLFLLLTGIWLQRRWQVEPVCLMVFNATFNNISVISWRSVLLVEETKENHDLSQVSGDRHWLHR